MSEVVVADLEYRQCRSCMQDMPVDQFDGDEIVCIGCFKLKERAVRRHIRQVTRKTDKILLDHLEKFAERHANRPPDDEVPNIGTVANRFLEGYGGLEGLITQHVAEFLNAKPGGSVRQRHLAEVRKVMQQAEQAGYTNTPFEKRTDKQIEKLFVQLMRRVYHIEPQLILETTGEVIDGDEAEAESAVAAT